jgi:hypothetical protein
MAESKASGRIHPHTLVVGAAVNQNASHFRCGSD